MEQQPVKLVIPTVKIATMLLDNVIVALLVSKSMESLVMHVSTTLSLLEVQLIAHHVTQLVILATILMDNVHHVLKVLDLITLLSLVLPVIHHLSLMVQLHVLIVTQLVQHVVKLMVHV